MNTVFLSIIYICSGAQAISMKHYTNKVGSRGLYAWVAMLSISAALFFTAAAGGKIAFEPALLSYSVAFAVSYAAATAGNAAALRYGPLSLTTLVAAYSLMIPTVYGMLFLHEVPSIWALVGLVLLLLSLFLIHYKKGEQGITKKWILFAFLCFCGNGMCSTTQKIQQIAFDGAYKSEFMIYALLILVISAGMPAIVTGKKEVVSEVKKGWYLALIFGTANGCLNLLVMVLGGRMPVSIMFPLISAGQILVACIISRFIYQERLSKKQLAGVALGVMSIVLFNL